MDQHAGISVLRNPELNKSTGFSEQEKEALHLVGLLPDKTETIDLHLKRVLRQLGYKSSDYERYIYLMSLLDHNETLFYKTVMSNPAYFFPIVYDPTIAEACLKFDVSFRQSRGLYLSHKRRGSVKQGTPLRCSREVSASVSCAPRASSSSRH